MGNHQLRISPLRPLTSQGQEAVLAEAQGLTGFLNKAVEHVRLGTDI